MCVYVCMCFLPHNKRHHYRAGEEWHLGCHSTLSFSSLHPHRQQHQAFHSQSSWHPGSFLSSVASSLANNSSNKGYIEPQPCQKLRFHSNTVNTLALRYILVCYSLHLRGNLSHYFHIWSLPCPAEEDIAT